ncbi:hypothetical protein H4R99_001788 [Coemansia sp. RSA 1722]|nr:hypothetical protein IWW45_007146 [Coemansia sp. RSA 485]KAJ2604471.1 hypothetical protein H4R99_001788 [Coemansia sp. RSA 1722]KAJ2637956.1 hypothetical protein GGF40_002006 [Coemansia sp. RSA 1286]KAJ2706095.1 hypothetical protein FB645_001852 [Coemansia sp. IMI 203386]
MPVTTLLRRVLNRSNTEPNLADAYLTPPVGQTPALELIPEQSPSIADDASHAAQNGNNALAVIASRGVIDEAPLPPDFSDSSSMDDEDKMPMGEELVDEKDAVEDLTNLDEDQIGQPQDQALEQAAAQDRLPRNAGFMRSFSNVVCIIIGTGCLQIPYAFSKTGWVGIIIVVLSAFIGGYTGVLTIRCLYYRSPERLHSFPQIGYAAFGRWGQWATQFFNYLYSLGTTCLYIILSGQFIYQLVSTLGVNVTQKVWMILVTIIIWIPVAILKEMSEAAIMAIFGLLASVVVIIVASVMAITNPYTAMFPAEAEPAHDIAIGIGIPVALSSIVFSYSGSVVYPHVEASMKKPKQWPNVVYSAMGFCAVCYLLIGVAGYWAYGDLVVSPVLDSIPTGAAATASKILITLHVMIAAPIMLLSFYLEVEKMWNITPERLGKKREFTVRLVYRSVVVGVVCAISLAIPYFSDFLGLISSIACVTMYAILPIICYLKLYGHRVAPWYEKIWMVVVLVIGVVASIWGSVDAIKSLIRDTKG